MAIPHPSFLILHFDNDMAETFIKRAVYTIAEAFRNCLKRFPVTVVFVFALSGHLIYLLAVKGNVSNDKLVYTISYYLSVGTLLSLTLHLWSEEMKKKATRLVTHSIGHALLLADTCFLYFQSPDRVWTEIIIAHSAAILALGLSVFFLSFFREKNDVSSWNFALSSLGLFVTANIMGSIMSGGLCLLLFSLQKLFGLDIDTRGYGYITILCNVLLAMMLFLGLLPKGKAKHDRKPLTGSFLNTAAHYLFLPLMAAYLLVLYVYAAKIIVSWELPNGWVSWLVTALMIGCIAIEFSIYPTRMALPGKWNERIARWLPMLVLPMLVLMSVGIARRFNDYGITINRLYLTTFNIWCYGVCIGLFLTKAKRINWIPISFSIIFLLTSVLPVNFASITRHHIHHDIETALAQSNITQLPLSQERYEAWMETLPEETANDINDKRIYLVKWFGDESINDLTDKVYYVYVKAPDRNEPLSGSSDAKKISIPEGYRQLILVHYEDEAPDNSENKKISIPISRWVEESDDTIHIDINMLKTLDSKYPQGKMPPTWIECSSRKYKFIMTEFFYSTYNNRVELHGYLFMK